MNNGNMKTFIVALKDNKHLIFYSNSLKIEGGFIIFDYGLVAQDEVLYVTPQIKIY